MSTSKVFGTLVLICLVVVVCWGAGAYLFCKCQVKSDAKEQTCSRQDDGWCFPMKILSKECKFEDDCKFGTCANPSCSGKAEGDCTMETGCKWNKEQPAIPGACAQQVGKTGGDCVSKTTSDACTGGDGGENCQWNDEQPKVDASCSIADQYTTCGQKEAGKCGAPCVYSPKKENFASGQEYNSAGPRRFILRNEDHLRRMLRDAGWDGQGGGWCPFANGIGCG